MKYLYGVIPIILGGVGFVACIVGMIYVWPLSDEYLGEAEEVATSADETLTNLHRRLNRVEDRLTRVSEELDDIQTKADELAAKGVAGDQQALAKLDSLMDEVSSYIYRAELFVEKLDSATITLRNIIQTIKAFTKDPEKSARLQRFDEVVEEAQKSINGFHSRLAGARENLDFNQTAQEMGNLTGGLNDLVGRVESRVSEINGEVVETDERVISAYESIVFWRKYGPWMATVLLIWIALAQACLFLKGYSWLRPKDVP